MTTIPEMVQEDLQRLKSASMSEIEAELKVCRADYKALLHKEDIGLDANRRIIFLGLKIEELEKLLKSKQAGR